MDTIQKIIYLISTLFSLTLPSQSIAQNPGAMMGGMMQSMAIPQGLYTSQCQQYEALGASMCPSSLPNGVVHNSCTPERMKTDYPNSDKHGPEYTYELQLYCTKKEMEKETAKCEEESKKFTGRLVTECEMEEKTRQEHEASMQRFQAMFQIMMMCKSGGRMDCALAAGMSMMQISEANAEIKRQMEQNELRKQLQADMAALSEKYNPKPQDPGPPKPPTLATSNQTDANGGGVDIKSAIEDLLNTTAPKEEASDDSTQTGDSAKTEIVQENNFISDSGKTAANSVAALMNADPNKITQAIKDGSLNPDTIASGELPPGLRVPTGPGDSSKSHDDASAMRGSLATGLVSAAASEKKSDSSNRYSLGSNSQGSGAAYSFNSTDDVYRFPASLPESSGSPLIHSESGGGLEFLINRIGIHFTARMMRAKNNK